MHSSTPSSSGSCICEINLSSSWRHQQVVWDSEAPSSATSTISPSTCTNDFVGSSLLPADWKTKFRMVSRWLCIVWWNYSEVALKDSGGENFMYWTWKKREPKVWIYIDYGQGLRVWMEGQQNWKKKMGKLLTIRSGKVVRGGTSPNS